jgi:Na+/proline symporter
MIVAVAILLIGIVIWLAVKIAREIKRAIDEEKRSGRKGKKHSSYRWIYGSLHSIWFGVFGGVKYVYRQWKTAPPESLERFAWTMVLAALIAAALWIMLRILDAAINRESKPAVQPDAAAS